MTHFNSITARVLVTAGVKVFPCREGGPNVKAPYTLRGFKDATIDPIEMRVWYEKFPYAVYGFPCAMNDTLVLDADRHGKGDGVANIMSLFELHQFDCRTVPVVETPNGGYHFYFRRPGGLGPTKAKLCDAVDVRDNAYVIAPGGTLSDRRSYNLVEGTLDEFAAAIAQGALPVPPDWLAALLVHQPAVRPTKPAGPINDETVRNQVKGIMVVLLDAAEGERNNFLFWAACQFGKMIRTGLITPQLAETLLERAGGVLGLTAREIRATIASGFRKAWEGDDNAR